MKAIHFEGNAKLLFRGLDRVGLGLQGGMALYRSRLQAVMVVLLHTTLELAHSIETAIVEKAYCDQSLSQHIRNVRKTPPGPQVPDEASNNK